jgi:hypothetical protein
VKRNEVKIKRAKDRGKGRKRQVNGSGEIGKEKISQGIMKEEVKRKKDRQERLDDQHSKQSSRG